MKTILIVDVNIPVVKNSGKGIRFYNVWARLKTKFNVIYVPILVGGNKLPDFLTSIFDKVIPLSVKIPNSLKRKAYAYIKLIPYYDYQISNRDLLEHVWLRILEKVRHTEVDCLVCGDFLGAAIVDYGRKFLPRAKFIWDVVDSYWLIKKRQNLIKRKFGVKDLLMELLFYRYETKYIRRYDKSVMVGWADIKEHLPFLQNKLVWIPNGVGDEFFLYCPKEDEIIKHSIFFTGNMGYPPNRDALELFISKIFPKICNVIPEATLYIVGRNSKNIGRYNSRNINYVGYVSDIRPWISKAHVYVAPIRLGGGIKNKVLEALGLGRNIVAFPRAVDGFKTIPHSFVKVAKNIDEFVTYTIEILDSAPCIRYDAIDYVKSEYSWENTCNRYIELLDS